MYVRRNGRFVIVVALFSLKLPRNASRTAVADTVHRARAGMLM